LEISQKPDVVTRVFMLFKGVRAESLEDWSNCRDDVDFKKWNRIVDVEEERMQDAGLFRVLEWGGMEVYW
jgi:hypothetical protein